MMNVDFYERFSEVIGFCHVEGAINEVELLAYDIVFKTLKLTENSTHANSLGYTGPYNSVIKNALDFMTKAPEAIVAKSLSEKFKNLDIRAKDVAEIAFEAVRNPNLVHNIPYCLMIALLDSMAAAEYNETSPNDRKIIAMGNKTLH